MELLVLPSAQSWEISKEMDEEINPNTALPGVVQVMFLPQGCILLVWYGREGLAAKSMSAFEHERCQENSGQ
ncbi:hypothetical protein DV515_00012100 [Chloebia gouldiae]|uniref:Uncharacterized protein n=1 Tax=Chloebia gouldiae TaxID=44316 RepID=A0A3L8S5V1_CHLGU|nr:hypothetical protein DV515_00012100 [Chloebia gouldiae]